MKGDGIKTTYVANFDGMFSSIEKANGEGDDGISFSAAKKELTEDLVNQISHLKYCLRQVRATKKADLN